MRSLLLFSLFGVLSAATPGLAQDYRRNAFPPGRYGAPPGFHQDEPARLVRYWYRSYFRRPAAPQEVQHLANVLRRGRPPAEVLAELLASPEYWAYSGGTPAGFINQLILDVGHHHPTGEELSHHLRRLRSESPREVAYWFLHAYPQNWIPGLPGSPPEDFHDWE